MAEGARKKTLIGVLGLTAALGIMTAVPREESGRTVIARPTANGHISLQQIRGRQYLQAYEDVAGVKTACDGLTRDQSGHAVRRGERFTEAQCDAMLEASLTDTADHVMRCTPGLHGPGHDNERVAATDIAHNIGWPQWCRSSIAHLANAGAYRAAGAHFLRYDIAGGRHIKALHDRRLREQKIWMKDVA